MTRERLQAIPLEELIALARAEGYEPDGVEERAALVEFILDAHREARREKEAENNSPVRVEESKYEITDGEPVRWEDTERFPIPRRYNETRLVLLIRDPNWAFAYWDLTDELRESLQSGGEADELVLRVHDVQGVEFNGRNSNSSFDIPVQLSDSSWYIYLPNAACGYLLELGICSAGRYRCLARSNRVRTPRSRLSDGTAPHSDRQSLPPELFFGFDPLASGGASEGIPQRILAASRE